MRIGCTDLVSILEEQKDLKLTIDQLHISGSESEFIQIPLNMFVKTSYLELTITKSLNIETLSEYLIKHSLQFPLKLLNFATFYNPKLHSIKEPLFEAYPGIIIYY